MLSRRAFLATSAASVAHAAAGQSKHVARLQSMAEVPYERKDPRIAIVGVGGRGTSLLKNLLGADAKVVAICDIAPEHAARAQKLVTDAKQPSPEVFTRGDHDYERLMLREDIDLVITATPWKWHAPVALAAMEHGKHACIEVPGVLTLEDCWRIVHTSEKTRRHCSMLENCCYGYNETLVLRLAQAGKFGDILWGEGAYLHDLREILFSDEGEGLWRRAEHTTLNGNIYPTHGLGPVANYMDINRGDTFSHIVSMSTFERGLSDYRKDHVPAGNPKWNERYKEGDFNISLIKTAIGRTITVKHDTSNPMVYSRVNAIGGTKGLFQDYPPRIYFDGQKGGEQYSNLDGYKDEAHPLWKSMGDIAKKLGGHGGMDFIMLFRLLERFRNGQAPDIDVYDTALWSSVVPLSIASVAQGSAPQHFPEFLPGQGKGRPRNPIGS
jgi:hypothetical protein